MRLSYSIALLAALVTTSIVAAQSGSPQPQAEIIAHIRESIVQVALLNGPTEIHVLGTGFFVTQSGEYVITNYHVVQPLREFVSRPGGPTAECGIGVQIPIHPIPGVSSHGSFDFIDCGIIDVDLAHDVALLRLSRPISEVVGIRTSAGTKPGVVIAPPHLNSIPPREGEEVLILGYPLDSKEVISRKAMVANQEDEDRFYVDGTINPGNSGGPVVSLKDGSIVGIAEGYVNSPILDSAHNPITAQRPNASGGATTEVLNQNSGLAFVVPIRFAMALLLRNNVRSFVVTPPESH
jgi:S1-C subfamily serine protease